MTTFQPELLKAIVAASVIVPTAALILVWYLTLVWNTDWRSVLDRPLCFALGHPAPDSRFLTPTTYEGRAADLWMCVRCGHVITVIRPETVGRIRNDGGWDRRFR